jgi:hypothetical protein
MSRLLLPQDAAVRSLRAARLLRLLLSKANALHGSAALLWRERLLPEALLPLPAAMLAGLVYVRMPVVP